MLRDQGGAMEKARFNAVNTQSCDVVLFRDHALYPLASGGGGANSIASKGAPILKIDARHASLNQRKDLVDLPDLQGMYG